MSTETLQLRGALEGHNNWVTSLAVSPQKPDVLVSGSRDRSIIVWKLTLDGEDVGFAQRSLLGHSHIVEDVSISQDGEYVLSASWDRTMRLWSLADGGSTRFVGHEGDVMSCNLSADNNLIVSASRDKTVRVWDVLGNPLISLGNPTAHSDWVSSVHFTPDNQPRVISAGHDKVLKVSNSFKLLTTLVVGGAEGELGGYDVKQYLLLLSTSMRALFPPRSLIHLLKGRKYEVTKLRLEVC